MGGRTASGEAKIRASLSCGKATTEKGYSAARWVPPKALAVPNDRATRRESGSKLTALQTLRDNVRAPVVAKRLECVRLAGAFPIVRPIHNSEMRPAKMSLRKTAFRNTFPPVKSPA